MSRIALITSVALIALGPRAIARDFTAGKLEVVDPWARATPKGASVAGGYFKITNKGSAPDRLVGGTSEIAKRFELHVMKMDKGVMTMRGIGDGIEIKPGETIEFKPGGYHAMFVDLSQQLKQGEHVKATLQFEKSGKVVVDFSVEGIGAQHASGADVNNHADDGAMPMKMK
jgi:copper(I)-binding protein